jgi:gag-polypeptide of LTR copia-type
VESDSADDYVRDSESQSDGGAEWGRDREERLRARLRSKYQVSQATVNTVLAGIPQLRDRDFDLWMTAVGDAFHGAGMYSLFVVTQVQEDSAAPPRDLERCRRFPPWMMSSAWAAIRRAIGIDTTAFSSTLDVPVGDVKALLRALRRFFGKHSVPEQHRLLAKLRQVQQSDFRDVRSYVAALETLFVKLAKMGKVLTDDDKRYYLLEGLSEDFRRGVAGNIYAYETPAGDPADYAKAVRIMTVWEDGCAAPARRQHRDLAMPAISRGEQVKNRSPTQGKTPCIQYSQKGRCRFADKCRFRHVDAPGRPKKRPALGKKRTSDKAEGGGPQPKRPVFAGRCHKCRKVGHKRADCPDNGASATVDRAASTQDGDSDLRDSRANPRVEDRGWIQHDLVAAPKMTFLVPASGGGHLSPGIPGC